MPGNIAVVCKGHVPNVTIEEDRMPFLAEHRWLTSSQQLLEILPNIIKIMNLPPPHTINYIRRISRVRTWIQGNGLPSFLSYSAEFRERQTQTFAWVTSRTSKSVFLLPVFLHPISIPQSAEGYLSKYILSSGQVHTLPLHT